MYDIAQVLPFVFDFSERRKQWFQAGIEGIATAGRYVKFKG